MTLVSIGAGVRRESKVSGWKNTERASPKKTLRLRQQGMKFHNLPNCLGNMEMNEPFFTEPANRQAAFELLSAQGKNGENHDH